MIDRSIKPVEDKKISFSFPTVQNVKLKNGIELFHIKKNELPITKIIIITNAGAYFDPEGKSGTASLLSKLIDEGAGGLSAFELDHELELLGSVLSVYSDHENIYSSILSLSENLGKSLEIFAKIITNPDFKEEDFNREKSILLNGLLNLRQHSGYLANTAFSKELFKGTNYSNSVNGSVNSVKNITNSDIIDFYKKYFSANNSKFISVSNLNVEEIKIEIEKYFSEWTGGELFSFKEYNFSNNENKIIIIDKTDAVQTEIMMGHTSDSRNNPQNYFSRLIVNSILGGQFTSRLNSNLREEKGFTYGINSAFYYFNSFGYFVVAASVDLEHTLESLTEIKKEIIGMKNDITNGEINFSKSSLLTFQ